MLNSHVLHCSLVYCRFTVWHGVSIWALGPLSEIVCVFTCDATQFKPACLHSIRHYSPLASPLCKKKAATNSLFTRPCSNCTPTFSGFPSQERLTFSTQLYRVSLEPFSSPSSTNTPGFHRDLFLPKPASPSVSKPASCPRYNLRKKNIFIFQPQLCISSPPQFPLLQLKSSSMLLFHPSCNSL